MYCIDHRQKGRGVDFLNQLEDFGNGVVEAHLQVIDRFKDKVDTLGVGHFGNITKAIDNSLVGGLQVGLVGSQALQQAYDENGVKSGCDIHVFAESVHRTLSHPFIWRTQAEAFVIGLAGQAGRDREPCLGYPAQECLDFTAQRTCYLKFDPLVAAIFDQVKSPADFLSRFK